MLRRAFVLLLGPGLLAGCTGMGGGSRRPPAMAAGRSAWASPAPGECRADGGPVAILLPLTGPLSNVGQPMLQAAQLALAAPGSPQLLVRDTGGNPQGRRRGGAVGDRRRRPADPGSADLGGNRRRRAGRPQCRRAGAGLHQRPGAGPAGRVDAGHHPGRSRFAGWWPRARRRAAPSPPPCCRTATSATPWPGRCSRPPPAWACRQPTVYFHGRAWPRSTPRPACWPTMPTAAARSRPRSSTPATWAPRRAARRRASWRRHRSRRRPSTCCCWPTPAKSLGEVASMLAYYDVDTHAGADRRPLAVGGAGQRFEPGAGRLVCRARSGGAQPDSSRPIPASMAPRRRRSPTWRSTPPRSPG